MGLFFQKLAIPALLVCFILTSGCVWIQNRAECTSPYVSIGNRCCLDQDSNFICDENENLSNGTLNVTPPENGTVNQTGNLTNNTACPLPGEFVEFFGQGCHFCANMVPVVSQVENETGIDFRVLEIWYNKTNYDFMMEYASYIQRDCGALGVPTFINIRTNKSVCGQMDVQELGDFVQENKRCG